MALPVTGVTTMISPSEVIRPDGQVRRVKNLGWLLRHWKEVNRIQVRENDNPDDDAYLVAHMDDGSLYRTGWACRDVCFDWLRRPVFYGVPLDWFGRWGTVTKRGR